jgi:hypothetical protein
MPKKKDSKLENAGVSGYNKPKRTPNHPTKSHVVVAKEGDTTKTIRFGQQNVSGSPKREGESKADKARRESFKARHAANIAKGKMSAAFWADKVKWTLGPIGIILLLSTGEPSYAQLQQEHSNSMSALLTTASSQK